MNFISEAIEEASIKWVGGKGLHLQKLIKWKAPVAPFFVVTTKSFEHFLQTGSIPSEVKARMESFLKGHPKIALRSSMISEDNVDSSFAGLFDTLLDVTIDNWEESLKKIFSSVHSDRVQEYIRKKNLEVDLQMAVVVQELIEVDKSGVLFTRSPVDPTSAIAIDAAMGMGEAVVSGYAEVDHLQYSRTGELLYKKIAHDTEVLKNNETEELIETSLRLERLNKTPSDIEWGIKEGKLFIFQIRPITRDFSKLTYFVDTNLSESYPGTVSPFTASFVRKAYENVFKESARILGAGKKRYEKLGPHYEQLISCVDNHLYYNLEHYYAILRALPGGEKNIDDWHKMIGGKIEGHQIPQHKTNLSPTESILAVISLVKILLLRKNYFNPFLLHLQKIQTDIETDTRKVQTPSEIIFYLNHLINRPLGFGLTVINDVFVMMGLGLLTRSLKKKGLHDNDVIDLLKTSEGVDSLKPLEHFNHLTEKLSPEFIQVFLNEEFTAGFDPYSDFFLKMKTTPYGNQAQDLEAFIKEFGDRSFEELKLESLPLKNNPELLKQLIKWGKGHGATTLALNSEKKAFELSWIERKILNFTRDSIATREATRLWRGKFYHLLRELVLNLRGALIKQDSSWENTSILDFFSISHQDWLRFAEGDLNKEKIFKMMNENRDWQNKKRHFPEILIWNEAEKLPEFNQNDAHSSSLSGQGVSPGVSEYKALVLQSPEEALVSNLEDYILVTKNTDPAWVYIMSRSRGLISEKGSLLSHTAIIGRELNIPTIVGVKQATSHIKTGDTIRMDGIKGTIEIL